jgi:hypothetical protein
MIPLERINNLRPYGSEYWPLPREDGRRLQTFERRILKMIFMALLTIMVYENKI